MTALVHHLHHFVRDVRLDRKKSSARDGDASRVLVS
jgi:hypothetical protein